MKRNYQTTFFVCLLFLIVPFIGVGQSVEFLEEIQDSSEKVQLKLILKEAKSHMYSNPDKSMDLLEHSLSLARKLDNKKGIATTWNQKSLTFWTTGKLDSSIFYIEKAMKLAEENNFEKLLLMTLNNYGVFQDNMGHPQKALESYQKVAKIAAKKNDHQLISSSFLNIGTIYTDIQKREKAIVYYRKALNSQGISKILNGKSKVYTNIGFSYYAMDSLDSANHYFNLGISNNDSIGQDPEALKAWSGIADIHIDEGNIPRAIEILERTSKRAKVLGNNHFLVNSLSKLSNAYLEDKKFDKALKYAQQTYSISDSLGLGRVKGSLYPVLAACYSKQGNYKKAFDYKELELESYHGYLDEEIANTITHSQIEFDTVLKEKENELLKEKADHQTLRMYGLLGILAASILIGALIVGRQRSKIKQEKEIKKKERLLHSAEKILNDQKILISEMEQKRLSEELEHKSSTVSNLALHIVQKNEMLSSLDEKLSSIMGMSSGDQKIRDISIFVKQMLSLERDREEFQMYIKKGNQAFFKKLKENFPDLSSREKRLCGMIKLGLSSKEIASILNIETKSVEISRYRLRKSLNLENKVKLNEYLELF